MNGFQLAMELAVAFFAVLGFYGMLRWIAQRLFGSGQLMVAIEILTQRDAESAEVLIRDALSQYFLFPSGRILVLTTPALAEHPKLVAALRTYGLSCRVMEGLEEE